jgi:adenylate cyclase
MRLGSAALATERVERRLAAILVADVAGFRRLMRVDDEGTVARLKAHRRDLIDPRIIAYRGRIIRTATDALLAEFSSVVDAARCAAEVQRCMADRDADMAESERIAFRIGINLCDFIWDGDDIFGSGVEVAARLEELAEPGGICVSEIVRDQIHEKLPYQFEYMGERSFKNITRAVRVYAMSAAAVASLPPAPSMTKGDTQIISTRRLAAIVAADLVGYSRLIGADEGGTLQTFKTIRAEVFDPKIAAHHGRLVKTTGDGLLAEFSSVVDALHCATEIQAQMAVRNAAVTTAKRIDFRIGINVGDIVVEDGDIFGDGVNVAVRLEGLAESGGICVSARVQEDVVGKLDLSFEDMGDQQLKNIARSVRVYRVRTDREAEIRPPAAPPPLADKPSVAVLPFTNMSDDPEQEFFSDGMAEDINTALSRYPSLFVIARNSTFTYKGRAVDVKQVGRELGVRYVLEGSMRKAGNRIRVTAQLVEAEGGNHIWAERYDRKLADIFTVQDEITEAVTTAIAPAIADAERRTAMRKPPNSLDAWGAYQRGLWHVGRFTSEDNTLAQGFFRQAVELDPGFSGGYGGLALAQVEAVSLQSLGFFEVLNSAEALARRAVALDGSDAEARSYLCNALWMRGDYEAALAEAERALAMSPNLARGHANLGSVLIFSGRPKEGVAAIETAIRLDPQDPLLPNRLNTLALGHYFAREYEAAVEKAKRAIRSNPNYPLPYRWLAAALGQLGRTAEAKPALEKAITVAPALFDMYVRQRVPWHRPDDHAHMLEGLRKAGWVDQGAAGPEAR